VTGPAARASGSGDVWVGVLRRSGENVPRAAALAVWVVGAVSVVSALLPAQRARLTVVTELVGTTTAAAATATTAAAGIGLMLLAGGLRRRQRAAWAAAVGGTCLATVLHLLKGLDIEEAVATGAVAAALVATRRQFSASRTRRSRPVLPVLAGLLLADVALGLGLLLANHDDVGGPAGLLPRLEQVLLGLIGVQGPLSYPDRVGASVLPAVLAGLGATTLITALVLLLARPSPRPARTAAQDELLRRLLTEHGHRDSLGWFATRDDRDLVGSPSGKAAVSYRVVGGVALAAGDPLGDPEAWPGALTAFLEQAAANAWVPAVMGCGERAAAAWVKAGLDVLELGDEAVLAVAGFTVEGRALRGVRQAVARVDRAGYRIEVRRAWDLSARQWSELQLASARWRAGEVERGFSMALGRLGDARDESGVVVTAHNSDNGLRGLLHFAPWGPGGLSLDLMRRDPTADNGVNEAMIVSLLRAAPRLGVARVSLNFAIFRSALERGAELGAGPVARLWRRLLLVGSRWWQIEQLYRFNAKFGPEWVPRYLCYPGARELPRVALAALRAESFLVLPLRRDASRPVPAAAKAG
jgi:lysyl-tRNA synthetase class 2